MRQKGGALIGTGICCRVVNPLLPEPEWGVLTGSSLRSALPSALSADGVFLPRRLPRPSDHVLLLESALARPNVAASVREQMEAGA